MRSTSYIAILGLSLPLTVLALASSSPDNLKQQATTTYTAGTGGATSRRAALASFGAAGAALLFPPMQANAAGTDCMKDCLDNCKKIAPKDPTYCMDSCKEYCAQEDRTDGLSGSVSSDGGEMGILGTSTVVKGEDKPPSIKLPGLDFTSSKGRKLLGY